MRLLIELFIMALTITVGMIIGSHTENEYWTKRLVDDGTYEWVIDSKTGETSFNILYNEPE